MCSSGVVKTERILYGYTHWPLEKLSPHLGFFLLKNNLRKWDVFCLMTANSLNQEAEHSLLGTKSLEVFWTKGLGNLLFLIWFEFCRLGLTKQWEDLWFNPESWVKQRTVRKRTENSKEQMRVKVKEDKFVGESRPENLQFGLRMSWRDSCKQKSNSD